jgi:hypothetical protein
MHHKKSSHAVLFTTHVQLCITKTIELYKKGDIPIKIFHKPKGSLLQKLGSDLLTGLTPQHFCACPKPGPW